MSGPRVAISATFTAEPLREPLEFLLRLLGWTERLEFAPFAQAYQTLLDPASVFGRNAGGVNVLLLKSTDVETAAFARSVDVIPGTELLVKICGGMGERETYAVSQVHDPQSDVLGAIPYTPEYFAAVALEIAREVHRLRGPLYKVIAVDCDDTLWKGICGEDGPSGISLDGPRRALQEFLRGQRSQGKLLTIVSKNNEADAVQTFDSHPEMPLALSDFVARRVNWEGKAVNLRSLAAELNLAPDSFIFLDDNPRECGEVAAELPDVATLTLPSDTSAFSAFLQHVWAFDPRQALTAEDLNRNDSYRQQAERGSLERQSVSLAAFISSLELVVEFASIGEQNLARVAQLTRRTNQMNCTTIRRSEAEVREFLKGNTGCAVSVRDRFGDYGLVGVMFFEEADSELVVDTFLLSCRALGRGVEHRMLRKAGQLAVERRRDAVFCRFEPTPGNAPAYDFLTSIANGQAAPFRFDPENLAELRYRPSDVATRQATAQAPVLERAGIRAPDYQAIAALRTPLDLLAAVRREKLQNAPQLVTSEPPRTDLERHLCALWSELLHVPATGIYDNFFDLGGHSLLAVQLVSRLHQELQVDLPLEAVYTGTLTVAELARSIEIFQLGQIDDSEYATLLAEVEGMSDEEAEALLTSELERETRH